MGDHSHSHSDGHPGHGHHGHAHDHSHLVEGRGRALGFTLGANGLLLVAMVVGGALFGSLALWADAAHQATDVIGLVVAAFAYRAATRPGDHRFTYGLKRVEVLGALVNAVLLLASALWIAVEALRRLADDPHIEGGGVIVLALIALVINGAGAWSLHRHAGDNLNMRAAVVHLSVDAGASVVVLGVGVAVQLWDAVKRGERSPTNRSHVTDPRAARAVVDDLVIGCFGRRF